VTPKSPESATSGEIEDAVRDALPYVTALQLEKPVISDATFERGTRALEELRSLVGLPSIMQPVSPGPGV
jgi:hypothetical protein